MDAKDKKRYFAGKAANTRGAKVPYEKSPPKGSNNERKSKEAAKDRKRKDKENMEAGRKARRESASFPFKAGGMVMKSKKSKKPRGSGCAARTKRTKKY